MYFSRAGKSNAVLRVPVMAQRGVGRWVRTEVKMGLWGGAKYPGYQRFFLCCIRNSKFQFDLGSEGHRFVSRKTVK